MDGFFGPEGGPLVSTEWRLWEDRAWQNPDIPHILIPKGGLRSSDFYSRRTGVKEIGGCGFSSHRTSGKAEKSCPVDSHSHHKSMSHPAPPAVLHIHLSDYHHQQEIW